MKQKIIFLFLICIIHSGFTHAVPDSLRLDTISDHHWGWEVLLISNQYITLAIVPEIGGRILQFDLATDTFMAINNALLGQLFYSDFPTPYNGTWGYGGYKTWPAPQSRWTWPPPPTLAWGDYEYEVVHYSSDSVKIWLKGQTEHLRAPGLRFDRYITAYKNTTHIKITTVLFNDNTESQQWSIWDVTQTIVQHENNNDFTNFSAYFPAASPGDIWKNGGPSHNEVLPGVYRAKYTGIEGKLSASTSEGWVCFTDERDKQTYAKVFDLVEGAQYTHGGASVELYTSGAFRYMEVEVLGPIEEIGPNGDSIVFTEHWYASGVDGPFYTTRHGGVVKEKLVYNRQTKSVSGAYGAFHEGRLILKYLDDSGEELGQGPEITTDPNESVSLSESVTLPANTAKLELQAFGSDGNLIGMLDETDITPNDLFFAFKAPEMPVIDGIGDDECWAGDNWYPLNFVWLPWDTYVSEDDFSGRFKLSWTDERLLLLVEIVDDSLYDGHTIPTQNYWDDDCVEVFLDEDHSGGNHLYNYNAWAYHVSTTYDVVDNSTTGPALFNSHIDAKWVRNGNLYTWELAIKIFDASYSGASSIPVILSDGKEMGFSLAYCDNDGSVARENFIGSKFLEENVSNNSYIDASLFGTLTLIDTTETILGVPGPSSVNNPSDVVLYPNPASSDKIYYWLSGGSREHVRYEMISLTGEVIKSGYLTSGNSDGSIDINDIGKGLYLIRFHLNNKVVMRQIIRM